MQLLSDSGIKIKIVPQGDQFIIGSKSILGRKDNYTSKDTFPG